jgi:hypothetical protein
MEGHVLPLVLPLPDSLSFSVAGPVSFSPDERMNTPTHVACGACLAYALTCALPQKEKTRRNVGIIAVGALALGIMSHLLLDLLPHYAWIVYLDWFKPLPFHWLIREAVFGLAVAVPAFLFAGKAWPFVAVGVFGGMYPDFEKVLSVDFHVPDAFILFDWHSGYLSNRTGGLPKPLLIVAECIIIGGALTGMWMLRQRNLQVSGK